MPGLPALPRDEALALATRRLDLAPIRRADARAIFAWLRDPALHRFTGETPPESVEALERRYAHWESRRSPDGSELWLNWAVRLRATGECIGHLQATVAPGHATLAWTLGAAWQGRGYATEAAGAVVGLLRSMGVCGVRASIHPAHAASIGVAERLGLRATERISGEERIWALRLTRPAAP